MFIIIIYHLAVWGENLNLFSELEEQMYTVWQRNARAGGTYNCQPALNG